MSKDTPTEAPPWAYPGFERDFKIFLLSLSDGALSRNEYRDILRVAGVPLHPEPDPRSLSLETPSLEQPSLRGPQVPDLYILPEDPNFGFDPNTGFVYDLSSGYIVGQIQPDALGDVEGPGPELAPGDPGDLEPEVVADPVTDGQVDDDGKEPPS